MEAQDEPEPKPQAAPPALAPAVARLDVNIPLRAPRTQKGRYISEGGRLLRLRRLESEMHEKHVYTDGVCGQ